LAIPQSRLLLIQQPPTLSACSPESNLQGHNPAKTPPVGTSSTAETGEGPAKIENQKIIRQSSAITRPSQSFILQVCVGMENPNFSRINMLGAGPKKARGRTLKMNKIQVELVQTSSLQKLERSFLCRQKRTHPIVHKRRFVTVLYQPRPG
jgi:hypothetical protein